MKYYDITGKLCSTMADMTNSLRHLEKDMCVYLRDKVEDNTIRLSHWGDAFSESKIYPHEDNLIHHEFQYTDKSRAQIVQCQNWLVYGLRIKDNDTFTALGVMHKDSQKEYGEFDFSRLNKEQQVYVLNQISTL
jgi:hypothetical protein